MLYPRQLILAATSNPAAGVVVATSAVNAKGQAIAYVDRLEGMLGLTLQARLQYTSGGGTLKGWVQTSIDLGSTWLDIACFAFAQADKTRLFNLSGLTPKTSIVTPGDALLADDTAVDGLFGDRLRVKLDTSVAYVGVLEILGWPR